MSHVTERVFNSCTSVVLSIHIEPSSKQHCNDQLHRVVHIFCSILDKVDTRFFGHLLVTLHFESKCENHQRTRERRESDPRVTKTIRRIMDNRAKLINNRFLMLAVIIASVLFIEVRVHAILFIRFITLARS